MNEPWDRAINEFRAINRFAFLVCMPVFVLHELSFVSTSFWVRGLAHVCTHAQTHAHTHVYIHVYIHDDLLVRGD